MALPRWLSNLAGTMLSSFRIGNTGPRLKNDGSGGLQIRNAGDSLDGPITTSLVNVSGNSLVLNSAASESAASWKLTLARATSGMTADLTLTMPTGAGSNTQVLSTDGSGNLFWQTVATSACLTIETTTLAYNSTSPVTEFTLPANAVIEKVIVYVDTVFNATGPANLSVGISGTTSKYMGSTDNDLTTIGSYEVVPGLAADGSSENLIITFSAGTGGTTGSARIEIQYSVPTH